MRHWQCGGGCALFSALFFSYFTLLHYRFLRRRLLHEVRKSWDHNLSSTHVSSFQRATLTRHLLGPFRGSILKRRTSLLAHTTNATMNYASWIEEEKLKVCPLSAYY